MSSHAEHDETLLEDNVLDETTLDGAGQVEGWTSGRCTGGHRLLSEDLNQTRRWGTINREDI